MLQTTCTYSFYNSSDLIQTLFSITALAGTGCLHQPFGGLTLSSFSLSMKGLTKTDYDNTGIYIHRFQNHSSDRKRNAKVRTVN